MVGLGACYIPLCVVACWPIWSLAAALIGEIADVWGDPSAGGALFFAVPFTVVITAIALAAAATAAGLVVTHWRLGQAVARGGRTAATAAFLLVTVEAGGWMFVAYNIATETGQRTAWADLRPPATVIEWTAVAMLAASVWMLPGLSRARRGGC